MSKTEVKELSCTKCGAEIREAALFCYGCGTSVKAAADEVETPILIEAEKAPDKSVANDNLSETDMRLMNDDGEAGAPAEMPMRPAAAIRRRSRREPAKPIVVEWQPKRGVSLSFMIGSILFAFLALLIITAALYLR